MTVVYKFRQASSNFCQFNEATRQGEFNFDHSQSQINTSKFIKFDSSTFGLFPVFIQL